MIFLRLLLLLFSMTGFSFAKQIEVEKWELEYIKKVFVQTDTSFLKKRKKERQDWVLAIKSCRLQIDRGGVPLACYRSLSLERRFKKRDLEQRRKILREFDHFCLLASQREGGLEDFLQKSFGEMKSLSSFCLDLIQRKKQELLYKKYGIVGAGKNKKHL